MEVHDDVRFAENPFGGRNIQLQVLLVAGIASELKEELQARSLERMNALLKQPKVLSIGCDCNQCEEWKGQTCDDPCLPFYYLVCQRKVKLSAIPGDKAAAYVTEVFANERVAASLEEAQANIPGKCGKVYPACRKEIEGEWLLKVYNEVGRVPLDVLIPREDQKDLLLGHDI